MVKLPRFLLALVSLIFIYVCLSLAGVVMYKVDVPVLAILISIGISFLGSLVIICLWFKICKHTGEDDKTRGSK